MVVFIVLDYIEEGIALSELWRRILEGSVNS